MRFIHKIGFNSFPKFKAYLKNDTLQHKPKNTKFTYILLILMKATFPRILKLV